MNKRRFAVERVPDVQVPLATLQVLLARSLLFERMLGMPTISGSMPKQTGRQGEGTRQFPQAFTHLPLIRAAFNLDRVLRRRSRKLIHSRRS